MYLQFLSFLLTDRIHFVEILPHVTQVSEWLHLTAFLGIADNEVHVVHISRVIIAHVSQELAYSA